MITLKIYTLVMTMFIASFSLSASSDNMGLILFENAFEITECRYTSGTHIVILQALDNRIALASRGRTIDIDNLFFFIDMERENILLYDRQIIRIPNGYCLVHVGIYRYETRDNRIRTVPALSLRSRR